MQIHHSRLFSYLYITNVTKHATAFMKLNFLKFSFIMAIAMVVMSACEKDSDDIKKPSENTTPFAMTYNEFITPEDVQIVSADTTCISVSAAYAKKMGITDFKDRAVTIWRTIGTVPFIRIITNAYEDGDKIILTTKRGEFCDMFTDTELSLISDIHVDMDYEPTRVTRAGTGEQYTDISGKYIDDAGVLHPAVIIFDQEALESNGLQTRFGIDKNYITAEEIVESNLSVDIINLDTNFLLDLHYPNDPEVDKEGDGTNVEGGTVHFRGLVGVKAKLTAFANVSLGWFKLKKLDMGIKGTVGAEAKLSVALQRKIKKEWEKQLMSFGERTMVFWVGPIPVPYTIKSALKQKTEVESTATVELLATASYTLAFEKSMIYEHGSGWRNTSKETKSTKGFEFDGIRGSASVESNTGTFFGVEFLLGGSTGPEFSFGPAISAEAMVEATANPNEGIDVTAEVGAYAGLKGNLEAKVKILGYVLAKWGVDFDLFRITLFRGSLSWHFTEESWNNLEVEWENSLKGSSSEWASPAPSLEQAPYILQGME